jgi:hypothetical protein
MTLEILDTHAVLSMTDCFSAVPVGARWIHSTLSEDLMRETCQRQRSSGSFL